MEWFTGVYIIMSDVWSVIKKSNKDRTDCYKKVSLVEKSNMFTKNIFAACIFTVLCPKAL